MTFLTIVRILFSKFRSNKEAYLKNLARDNAQLLINQIWEVIYKSSKLKVLTINSDHTKVICQQQA